MSVGNGFLRMNFHHETLMVLPKHVSTLLIIFSLYIVTLILSDEAFLLFTPTDNMEVIVKLSFSHVIVKSWQTSQGTSSYGNFFLPVFHSHANSLFKPQIGQTSVLCEKKALICSPELKCLPSIHWLAYIYFVKMW